MVVRVWPVTALVLVEGWVFSDDVDWFGRTLSGTNPHLGVIWTHHPYRTGDVVPWSVVLQGMMDGFWDISQFLQSRMHHSSHKGCGNHSHLVIIVGLGFCVDRSQPDGIVGFEVDPDPDHMADCLGDTGRSKLWEVHITLHPCFIWILRLWVW